MRTWLPTEINLSRHRKTRALARLWACHPYMVVGFLLELWGYCLEFQQDGDVRAIPNEDLATMAGPADGRALTTVPVIEALLQVGFVDPDGKCHDWEEYAGSLIRQRERDKLRHIKRRKIERSGDFTEADWDELLDLVGHRCAYCGSEKLRLSQDHVQSLSKGGKHHAGNILPCCRRCSSRKSDKELASVGMSIVTEVLSLIEHTRFALSNARPNGVQSTVEQSTVQRTTTTPHTRDERHDAPTEGELVIAELRKLLPSWYESDLDAVLKGHSYPGSAAASIRALGPGGIHEERGATWDIVGRGLQELLAAGSAFNAAGLRAFVQRIVAGAQKTPPAETQNPFTDLAKKTRSEEVVA